LLTAETLRRTIFRQDYMINKISIDRLKAPLNGGGPDETSSGLLWMSFRGKISSLIFFPKDTPHIALKRYLHKQTVLYIFKEDNYHVNPVNPVKNIGITS
jgi:hypothetical protein